MKQTGLHIVNLGHSGLKPFEGVFRFTSVALVPSLSCDRGTPANGKVYFDEIHFLMK